MVEGFLWSECGHPTSKAVNSIRQTSDDSIEELRKELQVVLIAREDAKRTCEESNSKNNNFTTEMLLVQESRNKEGSRPIKRDITKKVHKRIKPTLTAFNDVVCIDTEHISQTVRLRTENSNTCFPTNEGDCKDHELDKADEGVLLMDPRELLEDTRLTQIIDNTPEHVASGTETDISNEVASSPQTKSSDQRRAAAVQAIERINRWTRELIVASPTRIRTVPVVGVPHHLEVELNGLGEDCVISIWRAKCPSVASPTRIRTVPVVGVPHHLEVELNGLGEDCVMSIWRAKSPSVANPTRIRTVPVVGVPHHLEVELNGLGEDCVMSIWRAKCPSVANPTRIRTVPVVGVPHHLEVE
ncbi:hypothetical protein ACJJTC_015985 [Scirpophaga incertulas]